MIATMVRRGRTQKTVHVDQVPEGATDEAILSAAMAIAHETRSSLFGWTVDRTSDSVATVTLHTD